MSSITSLWSKLPVSSIQLRPDIIQEGFLRFIVLNWYNARTILGFAIVFQVCAPFCCFTGSLAASQAQQNQQQVAQLAGLPGQQSLAAQMHLLQPMGGGVNAPLTGAVHAASLTPGGGVNLWPLGTAQQAQMAQLMLQQQQNKQQAVAAAAAQHQAAAQAQQQAQAAVAQQAQQAAQQQQQQQQQQHAAVAAQQQHQQLQAAVAAAQQQQAQQQAAAAAAAAQQQQQGPPNGNQSAG